MPEAEEVGDSANDTDEAEAPTQDKPRRSRRVASASRGRTRRP
jgi:hypothetical protein